MVYVVLCDVAVPCYVVLCCVILCYDMCYVVPCCVMLCCVILRYAMLCYVV